MVVFLTLVAITTACALGVQTATSVPGGNRERGRQAIGRYGCGACHTIGGVPGAHGKVGPDLSGLSQRVLIAGRLANTTENLMLWIQHPQSIAPGTAMPEMGVTDPDARDIAAYLLDHR